MLKSSPGYLSGETLAKALGVSRTTIRSYIRLLRNDGYCIDVRRSKGYRLVKQEEFEQLVREISRHPGTRVMGHMVHGYPRVSSTNELAFSLATGGAPEGSIVLADAQGKGKGRLGRSWISPPGCNLYVSIIVRPELAPSRVQLVTLVAAVASAEAIDQVTSVVPVIKWPNDLLIEGKKVAGILTEADVRRGDVRFVVVGLGINVNMPSVLLPSAVQRTSTSLYSETGKTISRLVLLRALLGSVEYWYDQLQQGADGRIRDRWSELSGIEGRTVYVEGLGDIVRGRVMGIDDDGALLLYLADHTVRRVLAGDVKIRGW